MVGVVFRGWDGDVGARHFLQFPEKKRVRAALTNCAVLYPDGQSSSRYTIRSGQGSFFLELSGHRKTQFSIFKRPLIWTSCCSGVCSILCAPRCRCERGWCGNAWKYQVQLHSGRAWGLPPVTRGIPWSVWLTFIFFSDRFLCYATASAVAGSIRRWPVDAVPMERQCGEPTLQAMSRAGRVVRHAEACTNDDAGRAPRVPFCNGPLMYTGSDIATTHVTDLCHLSGARGHRRTDPARTDHVRTVG